MHYPATTLSVPAFLFRGCRPSLSYINLKSIAVAPLSNTSYSNKQHVSTDQHFSGNIIKDLQLLNNDWQKQLDKEKDFWQKQLDKEKGDWQKQLNKEKGDWQKQLNKEKGDWQKERDFWQKQLDKQYQLRLEDTRQITELRAKNLSLMDDNLRLEKRYNIRGALERATAHATGLGLIPDKGGVQVRLNALASTSDFQTILTTVVANRKLVQRDVESCIKTIYHELSKHVHGNQEPIIIPKKGFVPGEVAALEAFMLLQDKWTNPLDWKFEQ